MADQHPRNTQHARNRADHLKEYRWQPGRSGNPRGRPKRRTLEEIVEAQLDEDDGDGVTNREKVARVIVEKLLAAHPVVLREFLKRVWPEVSRHRIDASTSISVDSDIESRGKSLRTKLHLLAERLAVEKPDICPACGERCKLRNGAGGQPGPAYR